MKIFVRVLTKEITRRHLVTERKKDTKVGQDDKETRNLVQLHYGDVNAENFDNVYINRAFLAKCIELLLVFVPFCIFTFFTEERANI